MIPRNERKCRLCDDLEDEYHFVMVCPLYNEFRSKYIQNYYWRRPCMPKFIELMQSENKKVICRLATFVFKSFERRTSVYYN